MIAIKYGKRKVVTYRGNKIVVGGLTAKNKIDILLYISKEFASINSQRELYDRVLGLSTEIFEVDNVTLRLWDGHHLQPTSFLHQTEPPRRPLLPDEGFSGAVFTGRTSILIEDLSNHPEFRDEGETTLCTACAPLTYKDRVLGTIAIEKDVAGFYKNDDLEILEAMAAQLALAINEVRLVEGLIDAQEKINNDLRLGRIVQAQIIPPKISPWNGVYFSHYYEPMVEVSGDYIDVHRTRSAITLLIADVSGHGVSAALVTMTIHNEFRRATEQGLGLPEIMEYLGEALRPRLPDGTYFTCQLVRIHTDHSFSYVNAGHYPILVFRGDEAKPDALDARGLPLGIMEANRNDYPEKHSRLGPGDLLVLVTDGFGEQRDGSGQEVGAERLTTWLSEARREGDPDDPGRGARGRIMDSFLAKWKGAVEGVPRSDDLTLLFAQVSGGLERARNSHREARRQHTAGDASAAAHQAELSHILDSSLADNLMFLAKLRYAEKDYAKARAYLSEYLDITGDRSAQVHLMLGNIAFASGALSDASREYKKALSLERGLVVASLMLAKCHVRVGERDRALRTLTEAARHAPADRRLRVALAKLRNEP